MPLKPLYKSKLIPSNNKSKFPVTIMWALKITTNSFFGNPYHILTSDIQPNHGGQDYYYYLNSSVDDSQPSMQTSSKEADFVVVSEIWKWFYLRRGGFNPLPTLPPPTVKPRSSEITRTQCSGRQRKFHSADGATCVLADDQMYDLAISWNNTATWYCWPYGFYMRARLHQSI